jgi:DNA-binding protein HU-beta
MAKMTKTQIMATLAEKSGLSKKDATGLVDAMVELAYKEVKSNGEFTIPGIGKLVKVNRKARMGRNSQP